MDKLKLILPTEEDLNQVEEYKSKFLLERSSFDGTSSLKTDDVKVWLEKCNDHRRGINLPEGFVPATQYICIREKDNKLVGMLQIRHYLNEFLLNYGGHIG